MNTLPLAHLITENRSAEGKGVAGNCSCSRVRGRGCFQLGTYISGMFVSLAICVDNSDMIQVCKMTLNTESVMVNLPQLPFNLSMLLAA